MRFFKYALTLATLITTSTPALADNPAMMPDDLSSPVFAMNNTAENGNWKQAAQADFPNSTKDDHAERTPPLMLTIKMRNNGFKSVQSDFPYTPLVYQVFKTSDKLQTIIVFTPYNHECEQAANDANADNIPLSCSTYTMTFDDKGQIKARHSAKSGCYYVNDNTSENSPTAPENSNRVMYRINEKDHTISGKTIALGKEVESCTVSVEY